MKIVLIVMTYLLVLAGVFLWLQPVTLDAQIVAVFGIVIVFLVAIYRVEQQAEVRRQLAARQSLNWSPLRPPDRTMFGGDGCSNEDEEKKEEEEN